MIQSDRRSYLRKLVLEAAKARGVDALTLTSEKQQSSLFAPYSPSPHNVISTIWQFVHSQSDVILHSQDLLVDLGCGDGRWLISGVKRYQCNALGIELDPNLVQMARDNVIQCGLKDKIRIVEDDIMKVNIREAKLVIVYAFAESLHGIREYLEAQLGEEAYVLSIGVRQDYLSHSIR